MRAIISVEVTGIGSSCGPARWPAEWTAQPQARQAHIRWANANA
jgi:hypothetical protein